MEMLKSNDFLTYTKTVLERGRMRSLKNGCYIGGETMYGYNKEKLKHEKGYKLIINKEEAEIVKMIYELYIESLGTFSIANYLNKHEYKTRKDGIWRPDYIRDILTDPTYYGVLILKKRKTIKVLEDGKIVKKNITNKEPIFVKDQHEPIITKKQYNMVQEKMKNNRTSKVPRNSEIKNPLASLIECSICGHTMIRKIATGKNTNKIKRVHELDKLALIELLQYHKIKSGLSLNKISELLGISKGKIDSWLSSNPNRVYFSKSFSDNWFKLKKVLKIETDEFDDSITKYEIIRNEDILVCSTPYCNNVSSYLYLVEDRIIDILIETLKDYQYFLDNYEQEITKIVKGNKKQLDKIDKSIEKLNKELKTAMRNYNREDYTREEYLELKTDIEEELKALEIERNKLKENEQEDKVIKYKKAIPILDKCIAEYHNLDVANKNELLKAIIDKVIYIKNQGGRWSKNNNFVLEVYLKL